MPLKESSMIKMKTYLMPITLLTVLLTGCASQQLKLTTNSLIPTLRSIERDQVLDNLGKFLGDPTAVPVQVSISGGSAQIANQVQPSFAFPFHGWMGNQASVQLQGQLTVNWSLAPICNGDDLGRLRALYRYATGAITDTAALKAEYPPVRAKDPAGNPSDNVVKTIPYLDPFTAGNIPQGFASTKPSANAIDCGTHQGKHVWITSEADLDKFILWTFVAIPNTAGGGGGGGKAGAILLNAIQ
jgi:hypothetical protein